jgi:hypothetical protein
MAMADPEATPRVPKRKRKQLARQHSMDFVPPLPSDPSSFAKCVGASLWHRTETDASAAQTL